MATTKPMASASMKQARKRRRMIENGLRTAVERLESRTLLSALSWISGNVGDFSDPTNWVGGRAPNGGDDVSITGAGSSVTISAGQQVNTITTDAGTTLTISADGTLNDLSGGNIAGIFVIDGVANAAENSGTLTASGITTVNSPGFTAAGKFANIGTMTISGGSLVGPLINSATLDISSNAGLNNSSTITNLVGGIVNITATVVSSGAIVNFGTLNVDAGSGTQTLATGAAFQNNGGTVNVESGTLSVVGLSRLQGVSTFNASAGAAASFDEPFNGVSYLSGTITGTGAGTVVLNSGFFASALPDGTPADATFNFTSETANITGAEFDFQSNNNPFFNTGTLTFTGTAAHSSISMVNQGVIRNAGTTNIPLGNFTNDTTGLLDMQTDAGIVPAGGNTGNLLNMGIVRKSGGTAVSVISSVLTSIAGTIDVESGTISLTGLTRLQGSTQRGGRIVAQL